MEDEERWGRKRVNRESEREGMNDVKEEKVLMVQLVWIGLINISE